MPLALLGAFVFHLPIYWVYLLVMMDELAKWGIGTWRFLSKRWIHNVTQLAPPAGLTPAGELAAPVELAPPVELAQAAELPAGTGLTLADS